MIPDTNTPANPAAGPNAPTTLAVFLAQRDEPCPKCGYNLRGAQAAACPECGTSLELTVRRVAPLAGYALFLLLAFGWLFAAGTMNAVRNTRSIVAMARPSPFQLVYSVSGTLGAGGSRVFTVTPSVPSPTITIQSPTVTMTIPPAALVAAETDAAANTPAEAAESPPPSTESTIDQPAAVPASPPPVSTTGVLSPAAPRQLITQRTLTGVQASQSSPAFQTLRSRLSTTTTATLPGWQTSSSWQWSNIDPNTWVRASWAYVLALGGLIGLLLLALYHRHGCTVAARRRLVRAAAALFLIYAGAHVFWFSQEVFNLW